MASPKNARTRSRNGENRVDPAYRRLRRDLARVGYILKGSIQIRTVVCGQAGCRCHKNRRFRHGPYYWWTSKVAGKTVTYILTQEEGAVYISWIKNRQQMEATLEKLYERSARIATRRFPNPPPSMRQR